MSEEIKKNHDKPIEKMTIKELREVALEIPHEHTEVAVRDMNKEELIAFIKKAKGIKDEGHAHHHEKKKKAKVKVVLTRQDIKARISELKRSKATAHENKEKTRVAILRRRISRLKKTQQEDSLIL